MFLWRIIPAGLIALALSGCAGYQLGAANGLAAHGKSVQIAPFANKTVEPRLTISLRSRLKSRRRKIS